MDVYYSLQILRGLAAWAVVYHHYALIFYSFNVSNPIAKLFAHYGSFGVHVFFVLSGFIMAFTLTKRRPSAKKFAIDRLVRVIPNYYFYVLLTIVTIFVLGNHTYFGQLDPTHLLQTLLFIPTDAPPLLRVGWTLIYELFFYMTLSAFAFFTPKRPLLTGSLFLFLLPFLFWQTNLLGNNSFGNNFYLYEFIAGIGLYVASTQYQTLLKYGVAASWIVSMVGFVTLGLIWPIKIAIATAFVGSFLTLESLFQKEFHFKQQLVVLGNLSYSTYLCHTIVLVYLYYLFGNHLSIQLEMMVIALASVSIWFMSNLSYRNIESGRLPSILKNKFGA